jgi:hypothetical protein
MSETPDHEASKPALEWERELAHVACQRLKRGIADRCLSES